MSPILPSESSLLSVDSGTDSAPFVEFFLASVVTLIELALPPGIADGTCSKGTELIFSCTRMLLNSNVYNIKIKYYSICLYI